MTLKEPVQFIINADAGGVDNDVIIRELTERYVPEGSNWQLSVAQTGSEVVELAKRAVKDDYQTIVAGGGDGTINAVAGVLAGTTKTLGVLPLGTLNHFAKDLRLPLDLEGAMRTILTGHPIQIDVGEVNGRIFLNNSSLGLYPQIVKERKKQQRLGWGKWPAFIWAAVAVMQRYPLLDVRLSVDGKEFACRTPFVFIGNNKYEMEGFNIGSRRHLDKGELSLYVTLGTDRMSLVRLAFRALLGGLRKERDFTVLRTREVWIASRHRRLRVALDGEITRTAPPLHYRIRPQVLWVITPAPVNDPLGLET
jgi:diacylglycerol kinase family enzyme